MHHSVRCAFALATFCVAAGAAPLMPTGLTITVPAGTTDASNPYTDDVLLETITFGGTTFRFTSDEITIVRTALVTANRSGVNADYGDSDTGSDNDPNPFVKAGLVAEGVSPAGIQESMNPAIQDRAIVAAFSTRSLNQGIDGEGADYVVNLLFARGVLDSDAAADALPELVFFERGVNSSFSVRAITGGTIAAPILSSATEVLVANLWRTGVLIDPTESAAQELGVAGIDLSDLGAGSTPVYGVQITSTRGSGADLYGVFMTNAVQANYRALPAGINAGGAEIPESATWMLTTAGMLCVGYLKFRK